MSIRRAYGSPLRDAGLVVMVMLRDPAISLLHSASVRAVATT
ncbi:hypothetical protein [Nitrolancea hollandica]|nr:hypothetical protein [Nitrolancea hollandica]